MVVKGRAARAAQLPAPLTLAGNRAHTAETILRAWFEDKSDHTRRNYQHDLEDFALYFSRALGLSPIMKIHEALTRLFQQSSPSANEIALSFRTYLASANLAPASINRHISVLRSVTKLGRMLGMITWSIEIAGVKPEPRRQTMGPTVAEIQRMLDATSGDTERGTRDYAIVLTLYSLALRVSELCGMTLQETNFEQGNTWIKGKGRRNKELVPLPAPTLAAIERYLRWRGSVAGPLFRTVRDHPHTDGGLETRSVLRIVRVLGQRVGLHVWPHGLRHTSITQAAELGQRTGLGLDKIRAHSRHRTIATLMTYIDEHDKARTQRSLADLVARTISQPAAADPPTSTPTDDTRQPSSLRLLLAE
jgi:integrase